MRDILARLAFIITGLVIVLQFGIRSVIARRKPPLKSREGIALSLFVATGILMILGGIGDWIGLAYPGPGLLVVASLVTFVIASVLIYASS